MPNPSHILEFDQIDEDKVSDTGSKALHLSQMQQASFPVPPGFVISSSAYKEFVEFNNLKKEIQGALKVFNLNRPSELQQAFWQIQKIFKKASIPSDLKREIVTRYEKIGPFWSRKPVAVRSSSISADLPQGSQGYEESFLNVNGEANLLEAVKSCWSSLFVPAAILEREKNGKSNLSASIAVIVQQMVNSDISGVAVTSDPHNIDKHSMLIEAIFGLGDLMSKGRVIPDHYLIERHSLEILKIEIGEQTVKVVSGKDGNKEEKISEKESRAQKLSNQQIGKLGKILQKIHAYYYHPQNVEWAARGGKFYILHVRPLTQMQENPQTKACEDQLKTSEIVLQGQGASPGIVTGHVLIAKSLKDLSKIKKGEILVTQDSSPDFIPIMKLVAGLITDNGGVTSHASIISREVGLPCIVGTGNGTKVLKNGDVVTLDAKAGIVYRGTIPKREVVIDKTRLEIKPKTNITTATRLYINLSSWEDAKNAASLPVQGVGLMRAEFMVSKIGVHPRHLIAQGRQFEFVDKLSGYLESICQSFENRPVVYRTTDFKTNEYRNLEGGKAFEPEEENPLLGFRGALRYIRDPEVLELELAAVCKVREKYKNLWLMVPFVRTPQELLHVKRIIASAGLVRNPSFKLWMMVEIPINVILIEEFLKVGIDGISFGSNDLTMLLHAVDRDNAALSESYNELSPASLWAYERVIKACQKVGVTTSICGESVSSYDTLVESLVSLGITSVSVNSDSLGRVQKVIYEAERKVIGRK